MNIAERIGLEMEGLSMQMAALRSATEDRDTVDALALEIMRTASVVRIAAGSLCSAPVVRLHQRSGRAAAELAFPGENR